MCKQVLRHINIDKTTEEPPHPRSARHILASVGVHAVPDPHAGGCGGFRGAHVADDDILVFPERLLAGGDPSDGLHHEPHDDPGDDPADALHAGAHVRGRQHQRRIRGKRGLGIVDSRRRPNSGRRPWHSTVGGTTTTSPAASTATAAAAAATLRGRPWPRFRRYQKFNPGGLQAG